MTDGSEKKKTGAQAVQPDIKLYETAICVARMWGVLETLEPIRNIGFEGVKELALMLAGEFLAGQESDLAIFFAKRVERLKDEYGW